jgi:hypothetical protein
VHPSNPLRFCSNTPPEDPSVQEERPR